MKCYAVADFHLKFGKDVAISSLAVLEEKDKLRVLHDGTHKTLVNHRIKVLDRIRMPTVREKHCQMRRRRDRKEFCLSILGDFSKAHRRIKIVEREWGMLACQLEPSRVWVNCCGTFGISSAAYWWARASGAIIRCLYGLLGPLLPLEMLLFADDLEMTAASAQERKAIVCAIYLLLVLGCPLKWTKFRGGFEVDWIGLHINNKLYSCGLSQGRASWLIEWMLKMVELGKGHVRELSGGVGRINFAATALYFEKPWLGPLYSWLSALYQNNVEVAVLPWSVRMIFRWMAKRLSGEGRLMVAPSIPGALGDLFRSDAKAENGQAFVGGWSCRKGLCTKEALWFSLEITAENAPWAFAKASDPGRTIAALELLGTLLCLVLFDFSFEELTCGNNVICGSTDNQGNSFILSKYISTKWPITALLIETSEQLRTRGLELSLRWIRRELNTEADDLTNNEFGKFSPGNRIQVDLAKIKWIVLDEVLAWSKEIYDQVVAERSTHRPGGPVKQVKKWGGKVRRASAAQRLRNAQPW